MSGPDDFALFDAACGHCLLQEFREHGRFRVAPFLTSRSAARLHAELSASQSWKLVLNGGEKTFEIDRAGQAALDPAQRAQIDAAVIEAARHGFQYRYESIRVADDPAQRGTSALDGFADFLNAPEAIAWFREVTGIADIDYADAQATNYGPGDFLTEHDDAVSGKHRRAAYVLSLTPAWRIDWGGLLLFHDADDAVTGFAPGFNALTLFAVPQRHSVSAVAAAAGAPRYSVTGWLRSRSGWGN